jgi:hypothetical protein
VSADEILPAGAGPLLQDEILALIGYRFLALTRRSAIFDERLEPVRDWLRGGSPQPEECVVAQGVLGDFSYRPKHGISLKELPTGETRVRVAFFGTLCGDVILKAVAARSTAVYELDLVTRGETHKGLLE